MVHEKIEVKASAPKEIKTKQKEQEKENEIKINPRMANEIWNVWKFQISWNKLELVNPGILIKQKNPFCVSSKKLCLKDNNKLQTRLVTQN